MEGIHVIEGEVRELIRRQRLDPASDRDVLQGLVDDVVRDYEERSLHGGLAPLGDRDAAHALGARRRGRARPAAAVPRRPHDRGDLDQRAGARVRRPVRGPRAHADHPHRGAGQDPRRADAQAVRAPASTSARRSSTRPCPTARGCTSRSPTSPGSQWLVNIRKFVVRAHTLDDLVSMGSMPQQAARFLSAAIASGLNVLVSGGTQAGKTTMLNCLASAIPSHERVVSCEEVFELKLPLRDWAALQCRQASLEGTGEIPLRRLVKEALRMRPSRVIVGEVRQEESLDLLIALNSGLPGMCTIHANSAREAVIKMCTLPLLAGSNVSSTFVVPTVASAIDVVVHVVLERDGRRRVREIVALPGRAEGDVVELSDLFVSRGRSLERGDGFPPHVEQFERAGFDVNELLGSHG